MTIMNVTETVTVQIPDSDIVAILDTAGVAIGYWATSATVDEKGRTYTVQCEGVTYRTSFRNLAGILVLLAVGDPEHIASVAPGSAMRRYARNYIAELWGADPQYAAGEVDGDLADMLVQLALFKREVVYG